MKRKKPLTFASDGSDLPFGVFCRGCGAFQRIATPVEAPVYLAVLKAFETSHRDHTEERPGAAERLAQEIALARMWQ